MNITKNPLDLIGRLLIALLFVPAGVDKLADFAGTVGYISSVGLPMPQIAAVIAIFAELALPLAIIFGFKTRWAALALAIFTIATAFGFHQYWAVPVEKVSINKIMFYKNLAIAGGLFILSAHSGLFSNKKH